MTGVSHSKAVATIRKTKGLVHLIVSRPQDQNPSTYLAYLPMNSDKCNGNTGRGREPGGSRSIPGCHLFVSQLITPVISFAFRLKRDRQWSKKHNGEIWRLPNNTTNR